MQCCDCMLTQGTQPSAIFFHILIVHTIFVNPSAATALKPLSTSAHIRSWYEPKQTQQRSALLESSTFSLSLFRLGRVVVPAGHVCLFCPLSRDFCRSFFSLSASLAASLSVFAASFKAFAASRLAALHTFSSALRFCSSSFCFFFNSLSSLRLSFSCVTLFFSSSFSNSRQRHSLLVKTRAFPVFAVFAFTLG